MAVTAKVTVTSKAPVWLGDGAPIALSFGPDYQDGRNAEWAAATPSLSLSMTVQGPVADRFNVGDKITLTFSGEEN